MKTIIAGSRRITDYEIIKESIKESPYSISEIVSGGARGVDKLGEKWAWENNIPIRQFPAEWNNGKKAGFLKNAEMGDYADTLIAIWDGKSNGTKHMIDYATKKCLNVFVKIIEFKTSEEWDKSCNFEIIDPDGWDRTNLQFSWYEEEITKREFEVRLIHSTIMMKIMS